MPSLMRQINIITRCGMLWRGDRLKDTGLRPVHATYLLVLCHTPGLSQEQLARRIYINKSNVTRHLTSLEKAGFVERRQSETDRRVSLVFPTDRAYEILPTIRKTMREWNEYLTEDFSDEEIDTLQLLVGRIFDRATTYAQCELDEDEVLSAPINIREADKS
ncbi:MAG: MarR family transcriptional regulator [Clostridia bacterium]|nr:MarR family transcriptional regulator [Clostridia bacterium]